MTDSTTEQGASARARARAREILVSRCGRVPGTAGRPRRLTLAQLRRRVLSELGDQWTTPTALTRRLDLGNGVDWFQVALVLERLAADGVLELKRPGARVRRFRRRRPA